MKIVYHYDDICMNSLTGHTFIITANLEDQIELRNVSLLNGDQFQKQYITKFPLHHIPSIIVSNDQEEEICCFDESGTILRYLASKFVDDEGTNKFYPTSNLEQRAIIERAMDWRQSEYMPALTSALYGPLWGLPGPLFNDPAIINEAIIKTNTSLQYLANHLLSSSRKYIAGNYVSIAEFHIIPTIAIIRPFVGTAREIHIPDRIEQWVQDFYDEYPIVLETQSKVQIPHMNNMHKIFLDKFPKDAEKEPEEQIKA